MIFVSYSLVVLSYFVGLRRNYLLFLFLFILMWLIFAGGYNNADYDNYLLVYRAVGDGLVIDFSQPGYYFLLYVFNVLGFDYQSFLFFVSFFGLSLIGLSLSKLTNKINFIFPLYFIYPYLIDVVQVKHFLASSFIIYGFSCVAKKDKFSGYKFLISMALASSMHYMSIFFMPFYIFRNKSQRFVLMMVMAALPFLIYFIYASFGELASLLVGADKVNFYFENKPGLGILIQIFIQLLFLLIIFYHVKKLTSFNLNVDFADLVLKINIYLILLIPFYLINGTFERVFRATLILDYALFSLSIYKMNLNGRVVNMVGLFMATLFLFYWNIYKLNSDYAFYSIFEHNIFVDAFVLSF
jgi:hypothetical protein